MSIKSTQINCTKCHRKVHIMLVKCKHFNKINIYICLHFLCKISLYNRKGCKGHLQISTKTFKATWTFITSWVSSFKKSINWHYHMKDRVEIGHLTKYDAFGVSRDQAMNFEIWFKIHRNVSNFETASPKIK